MIFETHTLPESLTPHIEAVFHFRNFTPDHSIERVVPTGHIYIIFELHGMDRHTYDNETLEPNATYSKVWVSGMHRNYISISAHQDSEMFVIQFKPGGAHPFFHFPLEKINETVVPAEEILGEEMLSLHLEVKAAKSSHEKFDLAEKWLLAKLDHQRTPPKELLEVIKNLQLEPCSNYNKIIVCTMDLFY